jgi:hypothetical protein
VQGPAAEDLQYAEDEEADVPRQRPAEVVAYVVHTEQQVVDSALHDVEHAPARQHQPDVERPVRCSAPLPPALQGDDRGGHDEQPGEQVEQPVGQRVGLQPGDRRTGWACTSLTMWCHCRTWCSTMPSRKPPSPSPYSRPAAGDGSPCVLVRDVMPTAYPRLPAPTTEPMAYNLPAGIPILLSTPT